MVDCGRQMSCETEIRWDHREGEEEEKRKYLPSHNQPSTILQSTISPCDSRSIISHEISFNNFSLNNTLFLKDKRDKG